MCVFLVSSCRGCEKLVGGSSFALHSRESYLYLDLDMAVTEAWPENSDLDPQICASACHFTQTQHKHRFSCDPFSASNDCAPLPALLPLNPLDFSYCKVARGSQCFFHL